MIFILYFICTVVFATFLACISTFANLLSEKLFIVFSLPFCNVTSVTVLSSLRSNTLFLINPASIFSKIVFFTSKISVTANSSSLEVFATTSEFTLSLTPSF